ncbi:MAG: dTMP kinase [Gemmatimonadetes bacterium]|nr:dTMP kinase [Gemmatimonadota bacterium]
MLEGVEGSGKSTQAVLLAEWLGGRDIPHVVTREPGGTPLGEQIRRVLLEGAQVPPRPELLLLLAARSALTEQVIAPALVAGSVVVADRFELSSLAYQGYGRGLPVEEVRRLNAFATRGLRPDLVLLLEVPPQVSERRRVQEGRRADRIEQAGAGFHARVAEAYRLLAAQDSSIERLDGTRAAEEVHRDIVRRLGARFPETFASAEG